MVVEAVYEYDVRNYDGVDTVMVMIISNIVMVIMIVMAMMTMTMTMMAIVPHDDALDDDNDCQNADCGGEDGEMNMTVMITMMLMVFCFLKTACHSGQEELDLREPFLQFCHGNSIFVFLVLFNRSKTSI